MIPEKFAKGAFINYKKGGGGWFEGGGDLKILYTEKGGDDLKCIQNTEVRTWNISRVKIFKGSFLQSNKAVQSLICKLHEIFD